MTCWGSAQSLDRAGLQSGFSTKGLGLYTLSASQGTLNGTQGNDVLVTGIAGARAGQFQINTANTPNAGSTAVEEAFIIYKPTGQIMWALIDGAAQDDINLQIAQDIFDQVA